MTHPPSNRSDTPIEKAVEESVALPLEDNGKAAATSGHARPWLTFLRKLWRLPVLALIVVLSGTIALYFQPPALKAIFSITGLQPGGGTDTPIAVSPVLLERLEQGAVEVRPLDIVALGRLVPLGDIITLAPPFGAGDARVADILVEEGQRVDAGQLIATLDNERDLQAALVSAQANVEVRRAALAQTRDSVEASRLEAEANRDSALSALALAQSDFERSQQLFDQGIASQAALDLAQTELTNAQRALQRLEATLSRFTNGGERRQADIVLSEQNLVSSQADLARATSDLERAQVSAPSTGVILSINARIGEKPGIEGIATLANTDQMTAELEIYQSDIERVALGQSVQLSGAALGQQPLAGIVQRIGLEVGRQTLIADDPAANTDARVVEVTVMLDEASTVRAARLTGLEVVARIDSSVSAP